MEDDYESLPSGSTFMTHMIAGAAAGIMEHSVMYPVDCVKTRMQVLVPDPRADYKNVHDAFIRIFRYEGLRRTIRGLSAVVSGAGPAHALYFSCYEQIKMTFSQSDKSNHLVHGLAGCCATILHDAVMNPAEVVKQRMQLYNSPYKGCLDCMVTVLRTEGLGAFYRSYTTQLTMSIPFQGLHIMVYEGCQDFLNKERHYDPWNHVVSGGVAGGCAAAITTPLDVCKTLLNTQAMYVANGTQVGHVRGMVAAMQTVYKLSGVLGFFRGVTPRVIYVMPGTAISWGVYESFKHLLLNRNLEGDGGYISASIKPPAQACLSAASPTVSKAL